MDFEVIKIDNIKNKFFPFAWDIYEYSFPQDEKRTLFEQEEILKNKNYNAFGYIKDGKLLAILFFWSFGKYTYIEHFAVDRSIRGKSIGSKIMKLFLSKYKNVVLEIEPLNDEICKKRLEFYRKFNFIVNEYKHFQVPFRAASKKLQLLFLSNNKKLKIDEYTFLYNKMEQNLTIK